MTPKTRWPPAVKLQWSSWYEIASLFESYLILFEFIYEIATFTNPILETDAFHINFNLRTYLRWSRTIDIIDVFFLEIRAEENGRTKCRHPGSVT